MRFLSWSTKIEEPINDSSTCHVGSDIEVWYYSVRWSGMWKRYLLLVINGFYINVFLFCLEILR